MQTCSGVWQAQHENCKASMSEVHSELCSDGLRKMRKTFQLGVAERESGET